MKKLRLAKELSLPLNVVTEKIDILGQSGGGKTYLAMKLAELMLEAAAQIVVLDSAGVWWGLRASADGKSKGFEILVVGGEHGDLPISASAGAAIADLVVDREISVVLDVSEMIDEELARFVTDFINRFFWRKKRAKGPVHVFLEECQEFIPETPENKGQVAMRGACVRMMKIGRNYGIGWSAITQEPQAASKRALNQAGTILAVRTIGEHERKSIAEKARSKAKTKEQLAVIDTLPELHTGQALAWSPSWLKFAGVVHVLPKVTFDSSKTPEVGEKARAPRVLAPVEVEQLRGALAEVVAQAEKNDPTALQRRVAQLEAELARRPAAAPAKVQTKEVHVITEAQLKRLEAAAKRIATAAESLTGPAKEILGGIWMVAQKQAQPVRGLAPFHQLGGSKIPAPAPPPLARVHTSAPAGEAKALRGGERVVLTAIAQHQEGVSREQLSVLTGYKRSSRDTYLQRLRAAGYVDDRGLTIHATAEGIATLGADFQPLPTGDALREHWLGRLPEGERRVLQAVLSVYPESITREAISGATQYARSSRDTYLQRLSARRLVDFERGEVRASATLFSAGRAA